LTERLEKKTEKQRKLRVGILLGSLIQPQWIQRIIAEIQASDFAELVVVIREEALTGIRNGLLYGRPSNGNHPLLSLYCKFDDRSSSPYADPFDQVDLNPLLEAHRQMQVRPVQNGHENFLSPDDIREIRALDLDVLFHFGTTKIEGASLGMARYGTWYFQSSGSAGYGGRLTGFRQLMNKERTSEFSLCMVSQACDSPTTIRRSWTSTDIYSLKGNRSKIYWKSAYHAMLKLRDLAESGPRSLDEDGSVANPPACFVQDGKVPTTGQILKFLVKMGSRNLTRSLRNLAFKERWYLAYKLGNSHGIPESFADFQYMIPPKDRFWADPFPIEKDGAYYIFMEEFLYDLMKAHICVIEMDRDGAWKPPVKVLEREYHLSYPFVFQWENRWYMIPETKKNNTIELYRCMRFPTEWVLDRVLIGNVQAVDATLHRQDDLWWLFCNIGGKDFSSNDELHVFHAETPLGPWIPHKKNPIKSDVRSARPAGRLFRVNNQLYRPAQDCSIRMGGAISINKVTTLTTTEFKEHEAARIDPTWRRGIYGTHTLNVAGDLTMLDCFGYIRKFL
jgi:hypothetical protein